MYNHRLQDRLYNMLWANNRRIYELMSILAYHPEASAVLETLSAHEHVRTVLATELACLRHDLQHEAEG